MTIYFRFGRISIYPADNNIAITVVSICRKMLLGCGMRCRFLCSTKISRDDRYNVNGNYWGLGFSERNVWLSEHVISLRNGHHVSDRRSCTYRYTPPCRGTDEDVSACKTMFLRTIGWHSDGSLKRHLKWRCASKAADEGLHRVDNRGSSNCARRYNERPIRSHINSYHPCVNSRYKNEQHILANNFLLLFVFRNVAELHGRWYRTTVLFTPRMPKCLGVRIYHFHSQPRMHVRSTVMRMVTDHTLLTCRRFCYCLSSQPSSITSSHDSYSLTKPLLH